MSQVVLRLQILLIATLLWACDKPPTKFQSSDITGGTYNAEFQMRDQFGANRSMSDFKGKVVAMFFGFTNCPDVCPITLAELKSARDMLGPSASGNVQVVFVTLDPERDTPEVLKPYLGAFDPTFVGLRGTPEETRALAKQLRIFYQRSEGKEGNYSVDHSTPTFIFDREGRARLIVSYGAGAKVFAHDIKILLDEK